MTRNPYDVAIEQLGLEMGTLTELRSMGISTVGQAIDFIQRERTMVEGIPDLDMQDWLEVEERLEAYGYLNEYIDKIVGPDGEDLDEDYLDEGDLDDEDDDF